MWQQSHINWTHTLTSVLQQESTDGILYIIMFTKIIIIIKGTKAGIALQMDTYQVSTVMLWRNLVCQIQDNSLFLKANVNQKSTFFPLPMLHFFLFVFWPETFSYFKCYPSASLNLSSFEDLSLLIIFIIAYCVKTNIIIIIIKQYLYITIISCSELLPLQKCIIILSSKASIYDSGRRLFMTLKARALLLKIFMLFKWYLVLERTHYSILSVLR